MPNSTQPMNDQDALPMAQEIRRLRAKKNDGPEAPYQNAYLELHKCYGKSGALQQIDQYTKRYMRKGNRLDLIKIGLWIELLDECEGGPVGEHSEQQRIEDATLK